MGCLYPSLKTATDTTDAAGGAVAWDGGEAGAGGSGDAGVPDAHVGQPDVPVGGLGGVVGTGGELGGKGGQGGQATATGGGPGGSGGKSGQGGMSTETQPDAAAGAGGGGGQGGNTTQPQADASDTALGGAGGGLTGDAGGVSGRDVAADATDVGHPRRVLLVDEGNRRVLLVDLENASSAIWSRQLNDTSKYGDSMRDIQLVGGDRVAVSVAKGYVELDVNTGEVKKEITTFDGVESLRRLPSGNTVLGSNSNGGTTLQELDNQDAPVTGHKVTFTNYSNFRMLRRTPQGTFLIGAGNKLAEVNWDKQALWEMSFTPAAGHDPNYMYQGLILPDKTIAVTSGYSASILIVDSAAKTVKLTIGGKEQPDTATVVPNFYAGYQILPNGHFVVANWEGHGGGNGGTGIQVLEYDPTGLLVWKWKQTASLVSSIHHVIVLDGLDTTKLHDDVNGVLAPVAQ
jgi:hypothetical protein